MAKVGWEEMTAIELKAAAAETGIVSGVLRFEGSTVTRDTPPPTDGTAGGGLFITSHRFSGTVRIDRPVA